MSDEKDGLRRFSLRDVPGTTIAITSLAILAAAAVVTTPLWLWHRRKLKRTDALVRSAKATATPSEAATPESSTSTPAGDDRPEAGHTPADPS